MRNRFHALCPYFAMFPEAFAEQWIGNLTKPGEIVLDPFCGRGTAPFQAILMDRRAIGNDVNPVAYCLTQAKLGAATSRGVLRRIGVLERAFNSRVWEPRRRAMPPFFHVAFSRGTLRQLLFLRAELNWRRSRVDAMIAALVLGSLHGESERSQSYLSNQMPRTISTKPDYSLRFWERHGYTAPERDAFQLLRDRVAFRYKSELPPRAGEVYNADMRDLPRLNLRGPIKLAITSPPYLDVTDFGEDQWLRVWLLGGASHPTRRAVSRDDRHYSADNYWRLIADMWRVLGAVLAPKSNVVIRIGGSRLSPDQVLSALTGSAKVSSRKIALANHSVSEIVRRQTDAFRPGTTGCRYEVDAVFTVA